MKISKRLKIIKRPRIIKRLKIIIRMLLFRSLISLKHTFSNRSVSGFVEPATSFSFIVDILQVRMYPYGLGHQSQLPNGTWVFTSKYGPRDIELNQVSFELPYLMLVVYS